MALLEEEGQDLASRLDWGVLLNEALHTTIASENQGSIDSIATNGFDHISQDTLWDRTDQTPLYVVDSVQWQQIIAVQATTSEPQIRIRGGDLICTPAPAAGDQWAFEYVSKNWIVSADGNTYSDEFNFDTDNVLLPEKLLRAGLRWRWKKEKGFDYDEDFRSYEMLIAKYTAGDGIHNVLKMDTNNTGRNPRVVVPDGSFNL